MSNWASQGAKRIRLTHEIQDPQARGLLVPLERIQGVDGSPGWAPPDASVAAGPPRDTGAGPRTSLLM